MKSLLIKFLVVIYEWLARNPGGFTPVKNEIFVQLLNLSEKGNPYFLLIRASIIIKSESMTLHVYQNPIYLQTES